MNASRPIQIAISLAASVALCLAPLASAAQRTASEPAPEATPIHWPQSPRPNLAVSEYSVHFDGHPVSMIQLHTSDVAIEIAKRPDFALGPPSSPRYSAEIRSESLPGVAIGLSTFKAEEFLPDLSAASWEAYKAALKSQSSSFRFVFENSNIDAPATPYLLGQPFRQIGYQIAAGNRAIIRRELFAFVGETLLVFTVYGTPEAIEEHWQGVDRLLSELSLG